MRCVKLLIFLLILTVPTPGVYSNLKFQRTKHARKRPKITWEYVGKAGSDYWFRNSKPMHRTPEGHVLAWFRIMTLAPDMEYASGDSAKMVWSETLEENGYSVQLWEFKCQTGQARPVQDISYDAEGKITSQHERHTSVWSYPIPDSIGESTFRVACRARK